MKTGLSEHLIDLLGKPWASAEVQETLSAIGEPPEAARFEDTTHFNFKGNGLSVLLAQDGTIKAIQYYSKGRDGFHRYPGTLPHGLTMESDAEAVRGALGQATVSGKPIMLPVLGLTRPWDRYDFPRYSVHVEYSADRKAISLVTAMTPAAVPAPREA
jgi:filamentous hemagglutinin